MRRFSVIFICLCCFLSWHTPVVANISNLQIFDTEQKIRLNSATRLYWESGNQALSLHEVYQLRDDFEWPANANPNYGFSSRGLWLYNRFSNVSEANEFIIDVGFAQNDLVNFYLLQDGELIAQDTAGRTVPGAVFRFPVFEVSLPFAQELELLIRVQSQDQALVVPIDLQSKAAHMNSVALDYSLWGVFYGGLFILVFYNLVLFLTTREPSLIAYIGYIVTVVVWQLVWGGHAQLIFPEGLNSWFNQHTDIIFVMVAIGAGLFTRQFLNAWETAPRMYPILMGLLALLALLVPVSVFNLIPAFWQHLLVYAVSIVAICVYLVSGFESYLNQFKPARYFIFAWSLVLVSALVGMLGLVALLPTNFVTTYCFQFGVFFEAALFSIALIEKSRHQLENEVLEATNDLLNNLELIEEQNARLDIARKDAVTSNKVKSQFLANMSHEIRTPLNAILGFSRELTKCHLPAKQQEHVQIINSSASNLLVIVNDVLDFSKIEAGKLEILHEAFSPNELLEEVVFVNGKSAQKKQLNFIYHPCPLPEKLIGDSARIKQVLTNLLSNAIKFTNEGQVTLTVSGQELEDNQFRWRIEVADTGIGIDPKQKAKLFQAFSQLDDALTRSYQGTGLGLVICKQLVHLMRGKIGFASEHGNGTCFYVSLDCLRLTKHNDLKPIGDWQGKSLLLFDSNPESRRARSVLLTAIGAEVTSVESLDFLSRQLEAFDYLFADLSSVPKGQRERCKQIIGLLEATQKVQLTSDLDNDPRCPEHFDRNLDTPLLLSHLMEFHKAREDETKSNWLQQQSALPAANILAVDDMEINLRLLKTWLQDSPVSLTLCYSGEEAVKMCETEAYDLILMDVQMPEMDGMEATGLIRKTRHNQGTPIIAVTAHAFKEEKERLLNSGMDDYLPKPLDMLELAKQIQLWCAEPEFDVSHLEDIDWQLAVKRANMNEAAASDLMQAFIGQLPVISADISAAFSAGHWQSLQQQVHKLHGAACYTGVPKLQRICAELEANLKAGNSSDIGAMMLAFEDAVEQLLAQNVLVAGSQ